MGVRRGGGAQAEGRGQLDHVGIRARLDVLRQRPRCPSDEPTAIPLRQTQLRLVDGHVWRMQVRRRPVGGVAQPHAGPRRRQAPAHHVLVAPVPALAHEAVDAPADLVQVVYPVLAVHAAVAHAPRQAARARLERPIGRVVGREERGEARLRRHGRLQERVGHLERVHAAFEERVEVQVRGGGLGRAPAGRVVLPCARADRRGGGGAGGDGVVGLGVRFVCALGVVWGTVGWEIVGEGEGERGALPGGGGVLRKGGGRV